MYLYEGEAGLHAGSKCLEFRPIFMINVVILAPELIGSKEVTNLALWEICVLHISCERGAICKQSVTSILDKGFADSSLPVSFWFWSRYNGGLQSKNC